MKPIVNLASKVKKRFDNNLKDPTGKVPKIFYCHVPKCAGVAVASQIWQQIYDGYNVGTFTLHLDASQNAAKFLQIDRMRVREIVLAYNLSNSQNFFGTGHVRCQPELVKSFLNEWNFVTILRHPVNRWISEYIYNTYKQNDWEKNTMPIDEYLLSPKAAITGISFIRYFSSISSDFTVDFDKFINEAVENLHHFSVVGLLEDLDDWCNSFEKYFNKAIKIPRRNTSPNFEAVEKILSKKSTIRKIEQLCEPDIHVYRKIFGQNK